MSPLRPSTASESEPVAPGNSGMVSTGFGITAIARFADEKSKIPAPVIQIIGDSKSFYLLRLQEFTCFRRNEVFGLKLTHM